MMQSSTTTSQVANDSSLPADERIVSSSSPFSSTRTSSNERKSLFPVLLFKMLQSESSDEDPVVSWNSKGNGFKVSGGGEDTNVFESDVLPRYFGGLNIKTYKTFQRQLKLHGFVKSKKDNTHRHPKLQRHRPELVRSIQRIESEQLEKKSKTAKNQEMALAQPVKIDTWTKRPTMQHEEAIVHMHRRVSLDTAASEPPPMKEQQQQPPSSSCLPSNAVTAILAQLIAIKRQEQQRQQVQALQDQVFRQHLLQNQFVKLQQLRQRQQSQQQQGKIDNIVEMKDDRLLASACEDILPPQKQSDHEDDDAKTSLDQSFAMFLQEDDETW